MKPSTKRGGGVGSKVAWEPRTAAEVAAAIGRPAVGAADDPARFLVGLAAISGMRERSPARTLARNLCLAVRAMVDDLTLKVLDEEHAQRQGRARWDLQRTEIVIYHPRIGEDPTTAPREVDAFVGPDARLSDSASRARFRAAAREAAAEILGAPRAGQVTTVRLRRRKRSAPPPLTHPLGIGRPAERLWRGLVAASACLRPASIAGAKHRASARSAARAGAR